jgi:hypothetical protein
MTPVVWAGSLTPTPLPKLEDDDEHGLVPGGLVTTDESGEARIEVDDCLAIYVYWDTELLRRGCRKGEDISGNATCLVNGTSKYNNECGIEVVVQTPDAEIALEGTVALVGYYPSLRLTLVRVYEGTVYVTPVTQAGIPESEPIQVDAGSFVFTIPNEMGIEDIGGLPMRVPHDLELDARIDEELAWRTGKTNVAGQRARFWDRALQDGVEYTDHLLPELVMRAGGGVMDDPAAADQMLEAVAHSVPWRELVAERYGGQPVQVEMARSLPQARGLQDDVVLDDAGAVDHNPQLSRELVKELRAADPDFAGVTLILPDADMDAPISEDDLLPWFERAGLEIRKIIRASGLDALGVYSELVQAGEPVLWLTER